MKLKRDSQQSIARTLRALAILLNYPDATLRSHLPEIKQAILDDAALPRSRSDEIEQLIANLSRNNGLMAEEKYVEIFDRGRGTSLHLFEHVHGDSRDRGPAMVDLLENYEQAGLYLEAGELPDFLPVVLEYASTQPPAESKAFLAEFAHILRVIFSALLRRESPYASVLAGLLTLAGEKVQAVTIPDEVDIDDDWKEPPVFGGCSTAGQAAPRPLNGEQPINFVTNPKEHSNEIRGKGVGL